MIAGLRGFFDAALCARWKKGRFGKGAADMLVYDGTDDMNKRRRVWCMELL